MGNLDSHVNLPEEVVKLSRGLRDIQEIVQNKPNLENEIFAPPGDWKWSGEQPVISQIRPGVDLALARDLFDQVLKLLVSCRPERDKDSAKLEFVSEGDFRELINCTINGDIAGFNQIIERLEYSEEAADFAFYHTVKPFLKAYAAYVLTKVNISEWAENYCPVCGGKPGIARVEGSDAGKRYLRCGTCHTEWHFKLLSCPWCGNEDHRSLSFLRIEETPGYELHVCESCRGYIKVVNEKSGGDRAMLENESATLYLDLLAGQKGYRLDAKNA